MQETNLDADIEVLSPRVVCGLRDYPSTIIDGVWQGDFVTPAERRHHQWPSQ
jgi:hypothetical protein